jgi:pimeloyl-ACP methyl ester carboxylesterase
LTDHSGCEHAADGSCPASILTVSDVLRRLATEAQHDVLDTGRYRARYFVWGSGPPLVFVPGVAALGRSFAFTIVRLAPYFRCIAYDLPTGQGDGARLGRSTHGDLVQDLLALLDHLNLRQTYLFGSSFGSTIALAAMHAQPQRMPRAILQGGFACRPLAHGEIALARMARYWPGSMRMVPFRTKAMYRLHHGPFASCEPELWNYFLDYTGSIAIATLARHALLLHHTDLRPILSAIHQPVLMVCGDCDPLVRAVHEQILLDGLPNVRRLELENCGHFPHFTHAEVLAEVVRQFLTPPDGASPAHPNGEPG